MSDIYYIASKTCMETLLQFSELFDFDTSDIEQIGSQLGVQRNKDIPQPKAKFFDFISKELERQIDFKLEPYKQLNKKYIQQQSQLDALIYKNKLSEQKMSNLQDLLNEKPSRKDIFDLKDLQRQFQAQLIQENELARTEVNQMKENFEKSTSNFILSSDLEKRLDAILKEFYQDSYKKFALREPTNNKIVELQTLQNQLLDNIQEIQIINSQHSSDILKTNHELDAFIKISVRQKEFYELQDQLKIYATKVELRQVQSMLTPQISEINQKISNMNQQLEQFKKVLKKTDYEILQKATKMDQEILRKEQQLLKKCQTKLEDLMEETQKNFIQFQQILSDKVVQQCEQLRELMNNDISENITENVKKVMEQFELSDVQDQMAKVLQSMKLKANKIEILDVFNQKCSKQEIQFLEYKVNLSNNTCKQLLKSVTEFLELFGDQWDIESFNFKKNQIQKCIYDVNAIANNFTKINTSSERFRSDSNHEDTSRRSKNSPKVLLRPLLSTTYQVPFRKQKNN